MFFLSPIYIFIRSPILWTEQGEGIYGVFLLPGPVSDTNLFLRRVSVELYALSHALFKPSRHPVKSTRNQPTARTKQEKKLKSYLGASG